MQAEGKVQTAGVLPGQQAEGEVNQKLTACARQKAFPFQTVKLWLQLHQPGTGYLRQAAGARNHSGPQQLAARSQKLEAGDHALCRKGK